MINQRVTSNESEKRDIPSFIEPLPPLITNPFMRPRPNKGTNLMELFDEDSEVEEPELVQVYLRMKPHHAPTYLYEVKSDRCLITTVDTATAGHGRRTQHNVSKMYTFSHIFGSHASQKEIFERVVKNNLNKLPDGQSFTLLTYGASGSGKTFTLMGTVNSPGLVPRSLEYVFRVVDASQQPLFKPSDGGADKLSCTNQEYELQFVKRLRHVSASLRDKYRRMSAGLCNDLTVSSLDLSNKIRHYVWVSFVEIYNEGIYDLLSSTDRTNSSKLRIREDSNGYVYVKGATQAFVRSGEEAYDVMVAGKHNLQVAATGVHAQSSRSHCIFTITMLTETEGGVRVSCVRLCDLAGCERARRTRNTGARMAESRAINSSLHVLERCLHTLRRRGRCVPYRESKLTRLLGAGLSGAKGEAVSMVVTLNPAPEYAQETKHVLQLAAVAKDIQINNTIAETMMESSVQDSTISGNAEVMRLNADIERLHFELLQAEYRNKELMAAMEEKQQQTAASIQKFVAEARDICTQYYKERLRIMQKKMDDMREEYESRLENVAAMPTCETPSRELRFENAKLMTDIAILEEKLTAEQLARARAEEEVQHLRACIEERDDKTDEENTKVRENVISLCNDSETESDEEDTNNETLEPTFKKEDINRSRILAKNSFNESVNKENSATFDVNNSRQTQENNNQNDDIANCTLQSDADVLSVKESPKLSLAYTSEDDASDDDCKEFRVENHKLSQENTFTNLHSNTNVLNYRNDNNTVVSSTNHSMVSVGGTNDSQSNMSLILKDNIKDIQHLTNDEESKKKTTEMTSVDASCSKSDDYNNACDYKEFKMKEVNLLPGKICEKFKKSADTNEKKDGNYGNAGNSENNKESNFGNVSGKKSVTKSIFEECVEKVVVRKSKTLTRGTYCDRSDTVNENLLDKKTLSNEVIEPIKNKSPEYVNHKISMKTSQSNDSSLMQFEQLEIEIDNANLNKKKGKQSYIRDYSKKNEIGDFLIISNPNIDKRTYFDLSQFSNRKTCKTILEENKQLDDTRSPSIVKDEMNTGSSHSTMKILLGESLRQPDVISSVHKNNLLHKKHLSVDLFESPIISATTTDIPNNLETTVEQPILAQQVDTSYIIEKRNLQLSPKLNDTQLENTRKSFENLVLDKKDMTVMTIIDKEFKSDPSITKDSSNVETLTTVQNEFRVPLNPDTNKLIKDIEKLSKSDDCHNKFDDSLNDNTIDAFNKIYEDMSILRSTEFELLVSQDNSKNISSSQKSEKLEEGEENDLSQDAIENTENVKFIEIVDSKDLVLNVDSKTEKISIIDIESKLRSFSINNSSNTEALVTATKTFPDPVDPEKNGTGKMNKSNQNESQIESQNNNTIEAFDKIYSDILIPRTTDFDQLVPHDSINTTSERKVEETEDKIKYNLRHKTKNAKFTEILDKEENEEVLLESKAKCESRTLSTKRSLRLRRHKKVDAEDKADIEADEFKDIVNLQKAYSDITLNVPVPVPKEVNDISSPEKSEGENVPPMMEIQSCPSKSVTRSRRKLFTPRAETLDESADPGDSSERLCVPRPSYHRPRTRARRKL